MNELQLSTAIGDLLIACAQLNRTDKMRMKLKNILGPRIFFEAFGYRWFFDITILTSLPVEILEESTLRILEL